MTPIRIFLVFSLLVLAAGPVVPYYCILQIGTAMQSEVDEMLAMQEREMEMQGEEMLVHDSESSQPEKRFCSNCNLVSLLLMGYGSIGLFVWPLIVLCMSGKMSRGSLVVQTVIIACFVVPAAVFEVLVFFF